jgi:DNA-binding NtrC family response regulator
LPALRERREDILPLLLRFLSTLLSGAMPRLEPEFCERLTLHDWPFNVRELLLLARRLAVLHGDEPVLRAQHLPAGLGDGARPLNAMAAPAAVAESAAGDGESADVSLEALLGALRAEGGNVTRAAAKLAITRQRAYRLMDGQVDLSELSDKPRPKRR